MKRKNQDGAIVVEATLSLTTFMFLIVTVLAIVNICLAQAKVGVLIHGVAKEISNYTYLYTLAGLNEREKALNGKADYARNQIDDIISGSSDVFGTIEKINSVGGDSDFWESMLYLIGQSAGEEIKGYAADGICKKIAEKRLASADSGADAYLRWLGVVGGLKGLDFSKSEICAAGGDDIKVIVTYKVHMLKLLNVDLNFNFEQCAYTKTWCAK